jgi:hypothetical protein
MAIRVYPGTETPRLMSRTSNVRKPEWDLVCGNHQGQRQLPRDQQAGHKTVPDQGMPNRQKALATQEPSTQDISSETYDAQKLTLTARISVPSTQVFCFGSF